MGGSLPLYRIAFAFVEALRPWGLVLGSLIDSCSLICLPPHKAVLIVSTRTVRKARHFESQILQRLRFTFQEVTRHQSASSLATAQSVSCRHLAARPSNPAPRIKTANLNLVIKVNANKQASVLFSGRSVGHCAVHRAPATPLHVAVPLTAGAPSGPSGLSGCARPVLGEHSCDPQSTKGKLIRGISLVAQRIFLLPHRNRISSPFSSILGGHRPWV